MANDSSANTAACRPVSAEKRYQKPMSNEPPWCVEVVCREEGRGEDRSDQSEAGGEPGETASDHGEGFGGLSERRTVRWHDHVALAKRYFAIIE